MPKFAQFPNGATFQSYLGGPKVKLHASKNYSGMVSLTHKNGRREDFFWHGESYDGHGMDMCDLKRPKQEKGG